MATYLGYPFDPELFIPVPRTKDRPLPRCIESGAVQAKARFRQLIATARTHTLSRCTNVRGGTPDNYDGATDIDLTDPDAKSQSGIVFGRATAERRDLSAIQQRRSPMKQISSQVAKYCRAAPSDMLAILKGVFGVVDDEPTLGTSATSHLFDCHRRGLCWRYKQTRPTTAETH